MTRGTATFALKLGQKKRKGRFGIYTTKTAASSTHAHDRHLMSTSSFPKKGSWSELELRNLESQTDPKLNRTATGTCKSPVAALQKRLPQHRCIAGWIFILTNSSLLQATITGAKMASFNSQHASGYRVLGGWLWVVVGGGGWWWVVAGGGGVLVSAGGCWWVLVGAGGCWWLLVGGVGWGGVGGVWCGVAGCGGVVGCGGVWDESAGVGWVGVGWVGVGWGRPANMQQVYFGHASLQATHSHLARSRTLTSLHYGSLSATSDSRKGQAQRVVEELVPGHARRLKLRHGSRSFGSFSDSLLLLVRTAIFRLEGQQEVEPRVLDSDNNKTQKLPPKLTRYRLNELHRILPWPSLLLNVSSRSSWSLLWWSFWSTRLCRTRRPCWP